MRRGADPAQLDLGVEPPAPRDAAQLLARLRVLGLRRIDRCALTRNRTVMVSFGRGELRVHEGYLGAPESVLRAIVAFVEGRTRAERRAAQQAIVDAAVVSHVTPRPPERTHPDDTALVARLPGTARAVESGSFRRITARDPGARVAPHEDRGSDTTCRPARARTWRS